MATTAWMGGNTAVPSCWKSIAFTFPSPSMVCCKAWNPCVALCHSKPRAGQVSRSDTPFNFLREILVTAIGCRDKLPVRPATLELPVKASPDSFPEPGAAWCCHSSTTTGFHSSCEPSRTCAGFLRREMLHLVREDPVLCSRPNKTSEECIWNIKRLKVNTWSSDSLYLCIYLHLYLRPLSPSTYSVTDKSQRAVEDRAWWRNSADKGLF